MVCLSCFLLVCEFFQLSSLVKSFSCDRSSVKKEMKALIRQQVVLQGMEGLDYLVQFGDVRKQMG